MGPLANCLKSSVIFLRASSSLMGLRPRPTTANSRENKPLAGEIVKRGNQLAAGEISGEAEDDHDAGIGDAPTRGLDGAVCVRFEPLVPPRNCDATRCRASSSELESEQTRCAIARDSNAWLAASSYSLLLPLLSVPRGRRTSGAWRRASYRRRCAPGANGNGRRARRSAPRRAPLPRSRPGWSSGLRRNPAQSRCIRRAWDSSTSAMAVRSSSHELMTLPRRHTSAMSADRDRSECPAPADPCWLAFLKMSKPSA